MSDASDPLRESLREFLDAEKSRPDPPPEARQRTLSRLSTTLGLAAGLGNDLGSSVPAKPSPSPPVTTGQSLSHAIARGSYRGWATFLVGAAVGATAYGTVGRLRQAPKSPSPPPSPPGLAPPSTAAVPVEPMPVPEPHLAVEIAPRPRDLAPSNGRGAGDSVVGRSRDVGLAGERNLIEIARTALARGRIDGALVTLRRHARQYPKGQLGEERDGLLIQALVAKGDHAQARERALRFRRQHPASLFLPAVEQALQSIP